MASQVRQLDGEKIRVEGQVMKEFYVQVMSNASVAGFPSNQPNSFKNRLPNPLELREPGWKVGVSDLSLPTAVRTPNLTKPMMFRIEWLELADPELNIYAYRMSETQEGDLEYTPRIGTEFMNMIRDRYLWRQGDQAIEDLILFTKKTKPDDPTELLYMVMKRVENGQCVIDNTKTCTSIQVNGKPKYPKLTVGIELAKKMKWIKMGTLNNGKPGYVLGPNLRKEFADDVVPTARDLIIAQNNGDEIFYKIDEDALYLSA